MSLELIKTNDILAELGRRKKNQILVGFALETNNALDYARKKLEAKNLDMVVANTTSEKNPAFGADFNTITILDKHNNLVNFEFKSKQEIAQDVIQHIKANFLKMK